MLIQYLNALCRSARLAENYSSLAPADIAQAKTKAFWSIFSRRRTKAAYLAGNLTDRVKPFGYHRGATEAGLILPGPTDHTVHFAKFDGIANRFGSIKA